MVNYHAEFRQLLMEAANGVEVYYEAFAEKEATPCISYMETNNYAATETLGATVGYSRITYQVKVWGNDIAELQKYALQIDNVLRPLGFKRVASGELYDNNSTMIQKILTYEALASEEF